MIITKLVFALWIDIEKRVRSWNDIEFKRVRSWNSTNAADAVPVILEALASVFARVRGMTFVCG